MLSSSQLAALSHPLLPTLQHPRVHLSRTNSVFLAPADTVFSIVYILHLVGGSAQPMRDLPLTLTKHSLRRLHIHSPCAHKRSCHSKHGEDTGHQGVCMRAHVCMCTIFRALPVADTVVYGSAWHQAGSLARYPPDHIRVYPRVRRTTVEPDVKQLAHPGSSEQSSPEKGPYPSTSESFSTILGI